MRFGPSNSNRSTTQSSGPPSAASVGLLGEQESIENTLQASEALSIPSSQPVVTLLGNTVAPGNESPQAPSASVVRVISTPTSSSSSTIRKEKRVKRSREKLILRPMTGDGNCLFRSVCLQIYGDDSWHDRVREECVDFMSKDEAHFRDFVDANYLDYMAAMRRSGTFGDNPEIQAMAELYNRPVVVYISDADETNEEDDKEEDEWVIDDNNRMKKVRQMNIFHNKYASDDTESVPIRLLYRGRNHYDAVINPYAASIGVGLGFANFEPGKAERDLIKAATVAADVEETEKQMERAALAESLEDSVLKRSFMRAPSSTSSSSAAKKRKKGTGSPRTVESASSSSPGTRTWDIPNSQHPSTMSENLTPAVRELVLNGFDLEQVLTAKAIVGDSFDDILGLLVSSAHMSGTL